jgi:hypothetical protein
MKPLNFGQFTVIDKYNVADFSKHRYLQIYFQAIGTFIINGNTVIGFPGLSMNLFVETRPIYVSGYDELYLLGDCNPCISYDVFYGDSGTEYPVETPFYVGNLRMGGFDFIEPTKPTHYYIFISEEGRKFIIDPDCEIITEKEI